jgi:hypothetical protein
LRAHIETLLADGAPVSSSLAALQAERIERAFAFAATATDLNNAEQARQVATALYNVVTMAGMRWEAKQAKMPIRSLLADLVLQHRLAARDPITDPLLADAHLVDWLSASI